VTRAHEMYYREELHGVDDSRIIRQPLNRGTGVAVALALLHLLQRDVDPVFVLVPCDHYYADAEAFGRAVRSAIAGAGKYPDSVVLLGAEADYAETEYGWIELGSPISPAPLPLLRVNEPILGEAVLAAGPDTLSPRLRLEYVRDRRTRQHSP
jgi:mannose-1-phosphate guanylyltransferase